MDGTTYFFGGRYHIDHGGRGLCGIDIPVGLVPIHIEDVMPSSICPRCGFIRARDEAEASGEWAVVYYDPKLGAYKWIAYHLTLAGESGAWVNPLWFAHDTHLTETENEAMRAGTELMSDYAALMEGL